MRTELDTERTILVTAMHRPELCADLKLAPQEWIATAHSDIWEAINELKLDAKPTDPVAVMAFLEGRGKKSLSLTVFDICQGSYPASNPEHYASLVKSSYAKREAIAIAKRLTDSPAEIGEAIDALMALQDKSSRGTEWTLKQAVHAAYNHTIEAHENGGKLIGVTTGLSRMDEFLGGFHNSDLVIVGGRAAMGKTSLLLNMIAAAGKAGNAVGVISGEQPMEQVGARALSLESNVPAQLLRNGNLADEHWGYMTTGIKNLVNLPVYLYDESAPSLNDVIRIARKWKHQHGIKALYVDYLQRISATGERRQEEVAKVARGLKNLARSLNIPVIALAQVNRASEQMADKRPTMASLSDSSEIEKEADQVILIYREGYYSPEAPQNIAELLIVKNRHGATGRAKVAWIAEQMRFADLPGENEWR